MLQHLHQFPDDLGVAKATCEAHRAFLANVQSADENAFIVKQLASLDQLNIDRVWMGVSDFKTDGTFEWSDGTSISQYNNWQPNGPSNRVGYPDCGFYDTSDAQGKWNTGNCYEVLSFICKIKAGEKVWPIDPTTPIGTCDDGWNLFNGNCYYIETKTDTYDVGKKACEDKGSKLTSILDSDEQSYLSMRTYMLQVYLWIGLNDKTTSNVFVWEDGSTYNFKYWAPGQPDHFGNGDNERCVHFRYGELEEGMWNDLPCGSTICGYICKKIAGTGPPVTPKPPPTPVFNDRCGTGWEYDPTSKQCYLFKPGDLKTWQDARKLCQTGGGDLVSITTLSEQTYLNARLALNTETVVWLGANDLSSEGGWEWSNGSPFKFLNWASGEPNNWGTGGEHCTELKISNGLWNDISCSNTMGYVCKKDGYIVSHFSTYPNRYLQVTPAVVVPDIFPDLCAYSCVYSDNSFYKCVAFNYDRALKECSLLDTTKDSAGGLKTDADKDYYQLRSDAPPPDVPATVDPTYRCQDQWQAYGDYCYQAQSDEVVWDDARKNCRLKGADLASIWDANENSFVTSVVSQGVDDSVHFYIGLNDNKVSMTYEWSDDSEVTYTHWGAGEPNNYQGNPEDCGEMRTSGFWNDADCTALHRYVCKMKKQDLGPTQFPITPSGCDQGWIPYGESCYKFEDQTAATRDAALAMCQTYGGGLVVITDKYEQSVITSQMGKQLFYKHSWIGLHDRNIKGFYEWESGETFTYDNWGQQQPDESKGRCVYATAGTASGLWMVGNCNASFYYVCEKARGGFATVKVTQGTQTTPTNDDCAPGWIGYGSHCMKAFNLNVKLNFWSAENFCFNMGAHLTSFHSKGEEDHFVAQTVLANGDTDDSYWIGFHDSKAEGAFEWVDGSLVQWTNWHQNPKEPNDAGSGEDCTEMFFNGHGWNDLPCQGNKRNTVCLLPKGQMPATTLPPVTFPRCPSDDGFLSFNGYCYYLSPGGTQLGWSEAENYCHKLGADLASVHGQDEQDFLYGLVSGENSGDFWIGLREFGKNGKYRWADNTTLDYDAWVTGEPNDFNGEEECVEMYPRLDSETGGNWNDQNCGTPRNFICKKHESSVGPITHAPTPAPTGYCPKDSVRFLNRCYTFFGKEPDSKLSWRNASLECKKVPGGELATIHSQAVQAKLTSFLEEYKFHIWIGLSDITTNRQFKWIDGTTLDYTNWNSGEPNEYGGQEDCVEMYDHWNDAGEWNDQNCDTKNGYVCQSKPDPQNDPPHTPLNPCGINWSYWPDEGGCFQILPDPVTFSDAITACQALGNQATLASLNDPYEAAYADGLMVQAAANADGSITEEKPLWLGMTYKDASGEYSWLDNWPVFYTRWDTSEPSKGEGEGCVLMDFNGRWNDTVCTNKFGSLCKYSLKSPPTHPPDIPGTCDDGWLPYGSYCMYFQAADQNPVSEYQAERTCNDMGANLVTIHHKLENMFVQENILAVRTDDAAWLGLYRTDEGGFQWMDSEPVEYDNWVNGEPTLIWNGEHENCVEMYTSSGEWNDVDCNQLRTFICKKLKTHNSTDIPPTRQSPKPVAGLETGAIVGIVLGVLVLLLAILVAAFFVFTRNRVPKGPANVTDLTAPGFDNVAYASSGEMKYPEPSETKQEPAGASSA
ncbi:macrophage mannose receptor 1-like [Patiria miniata]|uniref:Macrophage mannose receptor 1-like n=1 Tax=Patiria miniata TaxID=46514 RepID=A0A914BN93_PATMI|nr:macrophage mannose receptor 1-like [Patiria miniata]